MNTRLVEIHENKLNSFSQSFASSDKEYALREIYVNSKHVIMLRPDKHLKNNKKIKLPEGLHPSQEYTIIYMNRGHSGIEITVVGDIDMIESKLNASKKEVLKG